MKKALILLLLIGISPLAFSQENTTYKTQLKIMLETSGAEQTFRAAITQIMGMYKARYPDVDAALWKEYETELQKTSLDDIISMLMPVYQKYLTVEDLKQMTAFYQTPTGRKYAENTTNIMQESMQAGQVWGMELAKRIEEKLSKGKN